MTSYVASTQATNGANGLTNTSLVIGKPAGVAAGDVGLVWFVVAGTSITGVTLAGWTLVDSDTDGSGPPVLGFLFKRLLDGSEAATATVSWTGVGSSVGAWSAYRGVDYATLAGQVDIHAQTGTARTSGTLVTSAASWIVSGFGDRSGSAWTGPDTERQEVTIPSSASLVLSDSAGDVAAGSITRTATATVSTGAGVSFLAALRTASGPAPTVSAGADQVGVEPYSTVALTATSSEASVSWTQLTGTTVTLAGSGLSRTFTAPPTLAGETLTFRASATSVNGTTTDDVAVTVLQVNERAVVGGVEVPMQIIVA